MKYIALLALILCCAVTVRASEVEMMLAGADEAASTAASLLMTVERAQANLAEQAVASVRAGDGGRVGELNEVYDTTKARVEAALSTKMQEGDAKVHDDQKEAADTSGGAAVASAGERGSSMVAMESNEMQGFIKDSEVRAERDLLRAERQNAEDVRMVEEQSDAHLREGIQTAEQTELDITAAIKRKEEDDEKQLRAKEEETIKAMVAKEEEMEKKLREAMYNMGKARLEGEQASEEHLKDEISKVVEERKALEEMEKQSTADISTTAATVNTELQQKLDLAQIERQKLLTEERNAREAEALLVRQQRANALNAAMTKEAMLARRRAELAIQREAQVIALRAEKQRARAAAEQAFVPMATLKSQSQHAAIRPAFYGGAQ